MYSAFHPSGVGTISGGNSLFEGTSLGPSPRVLKELGPAKGVATSQLGGTHIHAMHAGGRCGTSVKRLGGQVCQGQLSLPSFQGSYMSRGNLRLARGNSRTLPRALNLEAIAAARGLLSWNSRNGPNCYP